MYFRVSSLPQILATVLLFTGTACKSRKGGSDVRAEAGGYDGNYHGPNMSSEACAADDAKCICKLSNEFDKDTTKGSKDWYRQCIGQEIWYKATGGGNRFHGFYASQKLGVLSDWGRVLHTEQRGERFDNWGVINDPDCCIPDTPGKQDGTCRQKYNIDVTKDDTYGLDWCPGDDTLLKYVGDTTKDYNDVDPACGISKLEDRIGAKVRIGGGDDNGPRRYDSCYLAFGTSSGTLNMRKFPNPRFDKEKWRQLNNGSLWSWENYSRRNANGQPDYSDKGGKQRLEDASVQPPFLMGQSCGTCHIGFNPLHPPSDPNNPEWTNILGAIGSEFIHVTPMLSAGVKPGTVEYEVTAHTRAGVVDTSLVTNDYVHNDGTFNAIINFDRRPGFSPESITDQKGRVIHQGDNFNRFTERVTTWRQNPDTTWAESTNPKERIAHILKGGEDSASVTAGVLRVYLNIFSCTETCLGNHLDDLRVLSGRGSRQTPVELNQCRTDCPAYAALESRVYDEIDFLLHVRPTDLKDAKDPTTVQGAQDGSQIVQAIMTKAVDGGAPGSWYEAGKFVYGNKCAKCHSSHPGQSLGKGEMGRSGVNSIDVNTFMANVDARDANGVRFDWLGSDVQIPQKLVGTYSCRALHSNHMAGHLWEAYGSDSYRDRQRYASIDSNLFNYPDENLNVDNLGGRGFYRNISLLSVWAHAPFMHNNAVGPEWSHPIYDLDNGSANGWRKLKPIPTVAQRLTMYEESMRSLLSPPDTREHTGGVPYKVTYTSEPINLFVAPQIPEIPSGFWSALPGVATLESVRESLSGLTVPIPKGFPIVLLSSLKHKQIFWDLMAVVKAEPTQEAKLIAAKSFLHDLFGDPLRMDPNQLADNLIAHKYINCSDIYDNRGHNFTDLTPTEKLQLIDFMKTL